MRANQLINKHDKIRFYTFTTLALSGLTLALLVSPFFIPTTLGTVLLFSGLGITFGLTAITDTLINLAFLLKSYFQYKKGALALREWSAIKAYLYNHALKPALMGLAQIASMALFMGAFIGISILFGPMVALIASGASIVLFLAAILIKDYCCNNKKTDVAAPVKLVTASAEFPNKNKRYFKPVSLEEAKWCFKEMVDNPEKNDSKILSPEAAKGEDTEFAALPFFNKAMKQQPQELKVGCRKKYCYRMDNDYSKIKPKRFAADDTSKRYKVNLTSAEEAKRYLHILKQKLPTAKIKTSSSSKPEEKAPLLG